MPNNFSYFGGGVPPVNYLPRPVGGGGQSTLPGMAYQPRYGGGGATAGAAPVANHYFTGVPPGYNPNDQTDPYGLKQYMNQKPKNNYPFGRDKYAVMRSFGVFEGPDIFGRLRYGSSGPSTNWGAFHEAMRALENGPM